MEESDRSVRTLCPTICVLYNNQLLLTSHSIVCKVKLSSIHKINIYISLFRTNVAPKADAMAS